MRATLPIHKYRLLPKKSEKSMENEIRVKSQARPFVYAAYASKLLFEKKYDEVFMLATGTATAKVIQAVEFMRKRVKGLHVLYEIESTAFVDVYEPLENGLDTVEVTRQVPTLKANLSLQKSDKHVEEPGYMAPIADAELLDEDKFKEEVEEHFAKERGIRPGKYRNDRNDRSDRRQQGGRGRNYNNRREDDDNDDRDNRVNRDNRDNRGYRGSRGNRYNRDDREERDDRDDRDNRRYNDDNRGYRNNRNYNNKRQDEYEEEDEDRNEGNRGYNNSRGDRKRNFDNRRQYNDRDDRNKDTGVKRKGRFTWDDEKETGNDKRGRTDSHKNRKESDNYE